MIPIIDTHQHLWDLDLLRLPWIPPGSPLDRSFLMDDYLQDAAALDPRWLQVEGTLYMEVDVEPAQVRREANYAVDLCRRPDNPMRAAIVRGDPASDGFADWIAQLASDPYTPFVRGVRQVLHGGLPRGYCVHPSFIAGAQRLDELGLTFDICIRPGELADAAALAKACPGTQFVLDHCGNANVQAPDRAEWKRDIELVASCPNVACKISGIVASARPGECVPDDLAPIVRHCASAFGEDRLVFGGDWPVCTPNAKLSRWIGALHAITAGWSDDARRKLFHDNAVRVYGLA